MNTTQTPGGVLELGGRCCEVIKDVKSSEANVISLFLLWKGKSIATATANTQSSKHANRETRKQASRVKHRVLGQQHASVPGRVHAYRPVHLVLMKGPVVLVAIK